MEPEGREPERLLGWHVVEVGRRQAWPFIGLADPKSGREVRLYIDSTFSVVPGHLDVCEHDDVALIALDAVSGQSISVVSTTGQRLNLGFKGLHLLVDGETNKLTTHAPWWIGAQTNPT